MVSTIPLRIRKRPVFSGSCEIFFPDCLPVVRRMYQSLKTESVPTEKSVRIQFANCTEPQTRFFSGSALKLELSETSCSRLIETKKKDNC